ncbi:MAG: hypothetical protein L7F78_24545, partial [Syntrophales bacterium LBB04]|nr:hypothetical protein [Syntrophales bacterium LBB04]
TDTLQCSDRLPTSSMRVKLLTLSFVRLMLQGKSLYRRRRDVQRQLSLWPEEEKNIWEEPDPETHKRVIALLSRLIEKVVRPRDENQNDAPTHD